MEASPAQFASEQYRPDERRQSLSTYVEVGPSGCCLQGYQRTGSRSGCH